MSCDCSVRRIWRYKPSATPGFRARWWSPEAGPHLDPLEWSGPSDTNGFPFPSANAPDVDVINNSASVSDSNSGAGQARYGIIDGWVWLPDDVTHWRDINGNTGELGMVLSAACCGDTLTERPGGKHETSTASGSANIMDPNPVSGGWHYIYSPHSDATAFGGLQLQYSTDGGVTWVNTVIRQPTKPEIEGFDIPCCQPVPDGWSVDPLSECCDPTYTAAGGDGGASNEEIKAIAQQCIDENVDPHPEQEICLGNFTDVTSRTGWLHTWSPTYTANSGTVTEGWVQVSTEEVAPNCDVDLTVNGTMGNSYQQLRNAWGRVWYDVRLLINGTAVNTYTFQNYHYEDDIGSTNLDDDIVPLGSFHFSRNSVAAGSVITVEMQRRHNFVVGNAAVAAPLGRIISELRAHYNVHYSPTQIVTGRV